MSLSEFGSVKRIVKDLLEKEDQNNLSEEDLDHQFSMLIKSITTYISEDKYFFLFDWILDSMLKEQELLKIYYNSVLDQTLPPKDLLLPIIFKLNLVHSKIIETVVDEIYISYIDYVELLNINEFELAVKSKIMTLGLANSFILFLTENRCFDEQIFDEYIELISQALGIFEE